MSDKRSSYEWGKYFAKGSTELQSHRRPRRCQKDNTEVTAVSKLTKL
jgi:hypothetical protein